MRSREQPETQTKGKTMARFTTKQDVIDQAIIPALDNPADYDVAAIADEAFEYRVDRDQAGNELLNTAGFEQVVDSTIFWQIVAQHAL